MSEPLYVVTCPYCAALVPLFKVRDTARCTACDGEMKLVYPSDRGYGEAEKELTMLKKVKKKE